MSGAVPAIRGLWQNEDTGVEAAVDRAVQDVIATLAAELDGAGPQPATRVRRIQSADAVYHITGGLVGTDSSSPATVLVVVDRREPEPPSEGELRKMFGLTRKEATVARLLAMRRSNIEIAEELLISPHTARHHTESVMAKLRTNRREAIRDIVHEAALDS